MTIEIINKQEEKKEEKRLPYRPPDSAFTKLVNDKHVLYCPRCRTLACFISSDVCLNCFHWDYCPGKNRPAPVHSLNAVIGLISITLLIVLIILTVV